MKNSKEENGIATPGLFEDDQNQLYDKLQNLSISHERKLIRKTSADSDDYVLKDEDLFFPSTTEIVSENWVDLKNSDLLDFQKLFNRPYPQNFEIFSQWCKTIFKRIESPGCTIVFLNKVLEKIVENDGVGNNKIKYFFYRYIREHPEWMQLWYKNSQKELYLCDWHFVLRVLDRLKNLKVEIDKSWVNNLENSLIKNLAIEKGANFVKLLNGIFNIKIKVSDGFLFGIEKLVLKKFENLNRSTLIDYMYFSFMMQRPLSAEIRRKIADKNHFLFQNGYEISSGFKLYTYHLMFPERGVKFNFWGIPRKDIQHHPNMFLQVSQLINNTQLKKTLRKFVCKDFIYNYWDDYLLRYFDGFCPAYKVGFEVLEDDYFERDGVTEGIELKSIKAIYNKYRYKILSLSKTKWEKIICDDQKIQSDLIQTILNLSPLDSKEQ